MRFTAIVAILTAGLMAGGCSKANPMAPSASQDVVSTSTGSNLGTSVKSVAGATVNCDAPAFGNVVFSAQDFGKVTIRNASRCTNSFLFAIWDAGNYDDQTLVSYVAQTLAPGASAVMTLGIPNPTCTRYQRDVYFGITKPTVDFMHNYIVQWSAAPGEIDVFYANGNMKEQPEGICGPNPPSSVPPPVVTPPVVTPPVVDPPANDPPAEDPLPEPEHTPNGPPETIGFCHVEYHVVPKGKNAGTTFVHEQNLSIPQSAIDGGHSDPAHHAFDHYGACTGSLAPVITHGQQ